MFHPWIPLPIRWDDISSVSDSSLQARWSLFLEPNSWLSHQPYHRVGTFQPVGFRPTSEGDSPLTCLAGIQSQEISLDQFGFLHKSQVLFQKREGSSISLYSLTPESCDRLRHTSRHSHFSRFDRRPADTFVANCPLSEADRGLGGGERRVDQSQVRMHQQDGYCRCLP